MAEKFLKQLESERLLLRAIVPEDAKTIFNAYATDPEVSRYMTWRCTGKLSDTESFVREACAVWETGEVRWPIGFNYSVLLHGSGEFLGVISGKPDRFQVCVGYTYAKKHWGSGYATEALQTLDQYLFSRPEVVRLWAFHDIDNPASGRVLEKCGYLREGTLKRAEIHPNISPEPRDCVLWAKAR